MTPLQASYAARFTIPGIAQQIEAEVVTCAQVIQGESPNTANHFNRAAWASWALSNSTLATTPFLWSVALDPGVQASVTADPTGGRVTDAMVASLVQGHLDAVIGDWEQSPAPGSRLLPSLPGAFGVSSVAKTGDTMTGSLTIAWTKDQALQITDVANNRQIVVDCHTISIKEAGGYVELGVTPINLLKVGQYGIELGSGLPITVDLTLDQSSGDLIATTTTGVNAGKKANITKGAWS